MRKVNMPLVACRHWLQKAGSTGIIAVAFLLATRSDLCAQEAKEPATGQMYIGWARRDITPNKPVALAGQFHQRISTHVEAPLLVTALALEVRNGQGVVDQAILVSCDLVGIREGIQQRLRGLLEKKLPGFDLRKLILNATHTHTAPVTGEAWYDVTEDGVMKPKEYVAFLVERLSEAVEEAWQKRRRGSVNWGLGTAVVGYNRRMVYADGRAAMYGPNNRLDFRNVEGYEDHGVETLFCWNEARQLTGVAINVACPSQVVESARYISSDYWHDVREVLGTRYSKDLHVLAWCGAAGDQSPHLQYRRAADARMRKLQGNLSATRAIALRIADAVHAAHEAVKNEVITNIPFAHHVEDLRLPARKVTEREFAAAKDVVDSLAQKPKEKRTSADLSRMRWHRGVLDRYERPKDFATYSMELHSLRLGDVAIATNPFELFLDYGIQMKTRSRALQTFVIQLACATGGYLPTEKAVAGGGYSAIPESGMVGPEGGQILVNRTVEVINSYWPKGK